ncbi:MAG: hypothetical protein ACREE2_15065 [Stellaceae bacterium]
MSKRFFVVGHLPMLFAAFSCFGPGSMVWVLLGLLADPGAIKRRSRADWAQGDAGASARICHLIKGSAT